MSRVSELHAKWLGDPNYQSAYDELGPEFDLARSLIQARISAGLTQKQLAERMNTTQSVIARMESGRTHPSKGLSTRSRKVPELVCGSPSSKRHQRNAESPLAGTQTIAPLGALFGWGRRMFETGKAIREAKLRQIRDEGIQEGRREGIQAGRQEGWQETIELVRTLLEESGVSLPSDVAARLDDEQRRNGS